MVCKIAVRTHPVGNPAQHSSAPRHSRQHRLNTQAEHAAKVKAKKTKKKRKTPAEWRSKNCFKGVKPSVNNVSETRTYRFNDKINSRVRRPTAGKVVAGTVSPTRQACGKSRTSGVGFAENVGCWGRCVWGGLAKCSLFASGLLGRNEQVLGGVRCNRATTKATQQKEGRNGGRVHECNPAHHYQKLCCVLEPQGPQHCQATRRSARAKLPNSRTAYLITAATQPGMLRGQGGVCQVCQAAPASTHLPAPGRHAKSRRAVVVAPVCGVYQPCPLCTFWCLGWFPQHTGVGSTACVVVGEAASSWRGEGGTPTTHSVAPLIPSRPFG